MSSTPRGERLIIALIGKRNAGKSSLINALTGQEIAIVSEIPGTTTDPVDKHYELLPLGPVTFYDTAGVDDVGTLGEKRVAATRKILYRADIVIFVSDSRAFVDTELEMLERIRHMDIPTIVVFNKTDLEEPAIQNQEYCQKHKLPTVRVSTATKEGVLACKEELIRLAPQYLKENRILAGDLVKPLDHVILVAPIDSAAPKGRLILPQVQVLRDLMDNDAIVTVVKETELLPALAMTKTRPKLVITDSQVIEQVNREVPPDIQVTTFSVLFARYKGELDLLLSGTDKLKHLQDGDRILIAEACSHHVQKDDIGRVKLPAWIKQFSGKKVSFDNYAGHDFPENLEDYAVCIHCGACMINPMEMNRRIVECHRRGVPITNYGMTISLVQGVLDRVIAPLMQAKTGMKE